MKYAVSLLLVFSALKLTAQDTQYSMYPHPKKDSVRARNIRGYPDYFFVWPVLKQRKLDFEMHSTRDRKNALDYRTNKPYSFGLGMYLFEVGFEIAFAVPLDEQSKRIYGDSESKDIQANILGKKWGIDAFYQRYKGFYIEDPVTPPAANMPYPQRPDIRTRNTGVSANYIMSSDRFSFRSVYNFAERQLVSAGSFVVFGSLMNFSAEGDSAIIGPRYRERFENGVGIRRVSSTILGAAPGYTYSLIHRGFFLNGTLAIGPATNWISYDKEVAGETEEVRFSAYVAARLALGYNGDRFFGGLTFMNQGISAEFDNVTMSSSNSLFKISAGYRFREWGVLTKRAVDLPASLLR